MSAYRDALYLALDSPRDRIAVAVGVLRESKATVLVEGWVALRPANPGEITVEIVDSGSESNDADHYAPLIAEARDLLAEPALECLVAGARLEWIVVEDYGTGTVQVWPQTAKA